MNQEEMNEDVQDTLLGLGEIDNEIGRVSKKMGIQMTPQIRRFARSVASKRSGAVARNRYLTREQAIFAAKVKELPAQTVKDLQSGAAHIVDGNRYIAVRVTSATDTQEVLRNAPNAAVGITNIEDGRMPSTSNMLLSAVKVEIANHATKTDADDVEYTNIFDAGGLPSTFQNGEIEIQANGKIILPSTPLAKFFSVGGAAMVDNGGAVEVPLNAPKMIPAGAKVAITLRKPANGTLFAAGNSFAKVTLLGPETTTK